METEDTSVKKIDDILEIIDLLEKKSEAHQNSVLANIDALDEEISLATIRLVENNGIPTESLITTISENLLRKRPLANINMSNKKIYKYVSKLGKRIEKLKSFPDRNINFHSIDFDHKALKEAIAEYIVFYAANHNHEHNVKGLDDICEEMGLIDPDMIKDKIAKMHDIQRIEKVIKNRDIDGFINWVTLNESKLISIKSKIPTLAYEIFIIKEVGESSELTKVRELCKRLSSKFQQNRVQMKQFITALVFNNCCTKNITNKGNSDNSPAIDIINSLIERYRPQVDVDLKWKTIEFNFINDICTIYNIATKNPLFEVFKAGVSNYAKFINLNGIGENGNMDEVDINIDIGKEFTYHNIVVCPVSKEICSSDNPPVLLTCGHVISDASAKKLANFSHNSIYKKFKCPVCPSEQTYGKLRVLKIDK